MRLPRARLRFTVRRMMVAVAVVACIFWASLLIMERRRRFLIIAGSHRMPDARFLRHHDADSELRLVRWHDEMQAKYEFAAAHPWLPVAPDPPDPE
jgi:hypothetical protein